MAITKLNSLAIPDNTIVEADLSYPLTGFSSTGIDDNATSTAITIDASENVGIGTSSITTFAGYQTLHFKNTTGDAIQLNETDGGVINQILCTDSSGGKVLLGSRSNHPTIFCTNDTERARIDASGDVRVGPHVVGQASLELKVNGSSYAEIEAINYGLNFNMPLVLQRQGGNVGIGTSPSYKLDVDVGAPASNDQILGRFSSQAGIRSIAFVWDDSTSTLGIGTQTNHALAFHINGSSAEKMRIDTSGNLLVGTTSVSGFLNSTTETGSVSYSDGKIAATASGESAAYFKRLTDDGPIIDLRNSSAATVGSIGVYGSDIGFAANGGLIRMKGHSVYRAGANGSGLHFTTNGVIGVNENGSVSDATEDLGIPSYRWKDLYLSGGAYIGGASSANKLDDYEEGSWTPTASAGITGLTYQAVNCTYTKIGNTVHVRGEISALTGGNGATLQISGLPYNVSSNVESSFAIMHFQVNIDAGYTQLVGYSQANSNIFRVYECGDAVGWSAIRGDQCSSSTIFIFAATYQTS